MDETNEAGCTVPIVVDLGSRKKKRIKQLKRGEGPLVEEVYEAVEAVLDELGEPEESAGRTIVPVVLLYRRKPKKRKRGLFFPFR